MEVDDLEALIGRNIRRFRMEIDLSMGKLADAIEISVQQLHKYETGANRVSAGRLILISRELGVPVEKFADPLEEDDATS